MGGNRVGTLLYSGEPQALSVLPVGAQASGAGSSLAAVVIGSLIMEEKWVQRFPLPVCKSKAVTHKFIYLKEGQILPATVQRGRVFCSLVCVSLMAIHKPVTRGDPWTT